MRRACKHRRTNETPGSRDRAHFSLRPGANARKAIGCGRLIGCHGDARQRPRAKKCGRPFSRADTRRISRAATLAAGRGQRVHGAVHFLSRGAHLFFSRARSSRRPLFAADAECFPRHHPLVFQRPGGQGKHQQKRAALYSPRNIADAGDFRGPSVFSPGIDWPRTEDPRAHAQYRPSEGLVEKRKKGNHVVCMPLTPTDPRYRRPGEISRRANLCMRKPRPPGVCPLN